MKSLYLVLFTLAAMAGGSLHAQTPEKPLIEPIPRATEPRQPDSPPATRPPAVPATPPATTSGPASVPGTSTTIVPGTPGATPPATPATPVDPSKQEMQKSEEGYILKDAPLNDIFQFLAKSAGRQYFHNAKINSPEFLVTGHLNEGNPLAQMEELAFMYGLSLHTKGSTIYALTQAQLAQLPSVEFHYQLRYLRSIDIEKIKDLIKPMLSPGTGIVNFEPKTNTIVVIDSTHRTEQVRDLLHGIDKAKGQIIIETKILSVNSSATEDLGINWTASLGPSPNGTNIGIARDLNSIFGLPSNLPLPNVITPAGPAGSSNLVLSPLQLSGVLRALETGPLTKTISNPTLITEDNEQATMSIIARNPIITSTQSSNSGGALATVEVRYKIDKEDKSIDTDPDKHREIGVSMVVTPTLLPDGTIRMKLRPRSAAITGSVTGPTTNGIPGSNYPVVSESMIECIARVPDSYSLVVGGFFSDAQTENKTKIPLLGDIPVINFFFKSKAASKAKTSLVFIVTPKSYDPTNHAANNSAASKVRSGTLLNCDHDWIDPENPGPAHEPNLKRTIRGLQPTQAPYYPRTGETSSTPTPAPDPTPAPTPTPASKTRFSRAGHD